MVHEGQRCRVAHVLLLLEHSKLRLSVIGEMVCNRNLRVDVLVVAVQIDAARRLHHGKKLSVAALVVVSRHWKANLHLGVLHHHLGRHVLIPNIVVGELRGLIIVLIIK